MADKDQKIDDKTKLTLHERIEAIIHKIDSKKEDDKKGTTPDAHNAIGALGAEFCVVCGMARLYPDPTGVTCGEADCLSELGKMIKDKIDWEAVAKDYELKIRDLANILELDSSPDDSPDIDELYKDMKQKMEDIIDDTDELERCI